MRWSWLLILLGGLLTACGGSAYTVVEEDDDGPIFFDELTVQRDLRAGGEVGLRVEAVLHGFDPGDPHKYVRFSVLDADRKRLESTRWVQRLVPADDPDTPDSFAVTMHPAPMVVFDQPDKEFPPAVAAWLPYHWLPLEAGPREVLVELAVYDGLIGADRGEDVLRLLDNSDKQEPLGRKLIRFSFDMPPLYALRLHVTYLELDNDAFDPHQMDFSINTNNPNHGFPDLYWSLGIGYEAAYRSDRFRNSLSGRWEQPSEVVYVTRADAMVSLCAMDWDDGRFLNNKDDLISCWEGPVSELSADPEDPTVLQFDRVRRMVVAVEWLDREGPKKNQSR